MRRLLPVFVLGLFGYLANVATAQNGVRANLQCWVVFGGDVNSVSLVTDDMQQPQQHTLQVTATGYVLCNAPRELGWRNYGAPDEGRYITLSRSLLGGPTTQVVELVDRQLRECYKLGVMARANPARHSLNIFVSNGLVTSEMAAGEMGLTVDVTTATSFGCGFNQNLSGLQ